MLYLIVDIWIDELQNIRITMEQNYKEIFSFNKVMTTRVGELHARIWQRVLDGVEMALGHYSVLDRSRRINELRENLHTLINDKEVITYERIIKLLTDFNAELVKHNRWLRRDIFNDASVPRLIKEQDVVSMILEYRHIKDTLENKGHDFIPLTNDPEGIEAFFNQDYFKELDIGYTMSIKKALQATLAAPLPQSLIQTNPLPVMVMLLISMVMITASVLYSSPFFLLGGAIVGLPTLAIGFSADNPLATIISDLESKVINHEHTRFKNFEQGLNPVNHTVQSGTAESLNAERPQEGLRQTEEGHVQNELRRRAGAQGQITIS